MNRSIGCGMPCVCSLMIKPRNRSTKVAPGCWAAFLGGNGDSHPQTRASYRRVRRSHSTSVPVSSITQREQSLTNVGCVRVFPPPWRTSDATLI